MLLRIKVVQIESERPSKPAPVEFQDAGLRLLRQLSIGLRTAEKMLPGRSALFINAEIEPNPRFPLPREEALAYAIGLRRVVGCSGDITGRTIVGPDDEHHGGA